MKPRPSRGNLAGPRVKKPPGCILASGRWGVKALHGFNPCETHLDSCRRRREAIRQGVAKFLPASPPYPLSAVRRLLRKVSCGEGGQGVGGVGGVRPPTPPENHSPPPASARRRRLASSCRGRPSAPLRAASRGSGVGVRVGNGQTIGWKSIWTPSSAQMNLESRDHHKGQPAQADGRFPRTTSICSRDPSRSVSRLT